MVFFWWNIASFIGDLTFHYILCYVVFENCLRLVDSFKKVGDHHSDMYVLMQWLWQADTLVELKWNIS